MPGPTPSSTSTSTSVTTSTSTSRPLLPTHTHKLSPIASLTPPSLTRAWQSAPHPTLPLLASCSSDLLVRIYSLTNFGLHSEISGGHKRSIRSIAWKPQAHLRGESVLATGSFDASAGIWRRDDSSISSTTAAVAASAAEDGGGGGDNNNNNNNDDDTFSDAAAAAVDDASSDDDDWKFAVVLDGHESEVKSVAWSASGMYLATSSRDKTVWVWEEIDDDNTFETIAVLQEHDGDVKSVAWHPEEELLASASYDETVRLWAEDDDDWVCVAVWRGWDSTVWGLDWEGPVPPADGSPMTTAEASASPVVMTGSETLGRADTAARMAQVERWRRAGPRLVACSADATVRVWGRVPPTSGGGEESPGSKPGLVAPGRPITSTLRSARTEQEWVEEAVLPERHDRPVYSVAWSKRSGRVVSTGADGRVVVYGERWRHGTVVDGESLTEWVVLAEIQAAHGVFEVNHVCWSKRWDDARTDEHEEMIVTTGDDGQVKLWALHAI